MNYASTNEANNHDNDFPVMTGDDVAAMVCKSAASAPASVERLEDLAQYERNFLERLPQDGTAAKYALWPHRLSDEGLINFDMRIDANYINLTERGAALVRDYQRRQAESVVSVPEWQAHGFATEDEYLFMQSLGARDQEVVALEAENARLQGDLEAARAIIVKAGKNVAIVYAAMEKIQCLSESLVGDSEDVLAEINEITHKTWEDIK